MAQIRKSVVRKPVRIAAKSGVTSIGNAKELSAMLSRVTTDWEKPLSKPKDTGVSTAREMVNDVRGNDLSLATLLERRKPKRGVGRPSVDSMLPRMTPTQSSNVADIGYDREARQMFITFKSGAVYQYFEVPKNVYNDLMYVVDSGGSVGARFWDLVRIRGSATGTRYSYKRIKKGKR
jgi:hypothetical protein